MNIQDILDNIAAGENAAAKEGIENALSAKAFDALQVRKQELATSIFGGQNTSDEEVSSEDSEEEITNEE